MAGIGVLGFYFLVQVSGNVASPLHCSSPGEVTKFRVSWLRNHGKENK